jgi:hypothetical protein
MAEDKVAKLKEAIESRIDQETERGILQRMNEAKKFTEKWHDNIKRWRRLYNFDHYDGAAEPQEERYSDPTYTNTVDLAVGMFQANKMNWKAIGWTPSAREEKNSSQIEKFLTGVLEVNSDRNEYDIEYETNLHFARDGGAALYAVWDPDLDKMDSERMEIPDAEVGAKKAKVYHKVPVRVEVIDPLELDVLPGGLNRWVCVVRSREMSIYEVETEYDVKIPEENGQVRNYNDRVDTKGTFKEYWDEVEEGGKFIIRMALYFNEFVVEPLKTMKGYKSIPFAISFYKPTSRLDSGQWNSIIQPLEESVKFLEKAINRKQRMVTLYSMLPIFSKTVGGKAIQVDKSFPAQILPLKREEDVGFLQFPGDPPDIQRHIEYFLSRAQQSGFADFMYGEGGSDTSGYALSQMGDQNRIRLAQPVVHLERLWTWWARKVIELTSHFAKDCWLEVYGKLKDVDFAQMVDSNKLSGYYVRCEINPVFPNEEVRKHAMATQIAGKISGRTLMERYLNIQQPDDERKRMITEAAQMHPTMMEYLIVNELTELANGGDKAAALTLKKLEADATTKIPEGKEPNKPEQPLGTGASDGGATPTNDPGMTEGAVVPTMSGVLSNAK